MATHFNHFGMGGARGNLDQKLTRLTRCQPQNPPLPPPVRRPAGTRYAAGTSDHDEPIQCGLSTAGLQRPRTWAMKRDQLTPASTTRWNELGVVHA